MPKHEQHSGQPGTAARKEGGCCGGGHDHELAKLVTHVAEQGKKPSTASPGSHTDASQRSLTMAGRFETKPASCRNAKITRTGTMNNLLDT